jgi:multiple sugar transport system permease protein
MTRTLRVKIVLGIAAVVLIGLAVFPFYWMLVKAMTSDGRLFGSQAAVFPNPSRAGVFADVLGGQAVQTWLVNSAAIALGTAVLTLLLATTLAYALSRFRFRGALLIGLGLFATQMLPEATLVVPLFSLFRQLSLLDTHLGLILANSAFATPVVTLILKNAIDGVPQEVEEAARIDRCSRLGVLRRIVVPIIAPSMAAAGVIAFFQGWNEYLFALTFISSESLRPASVGLAGFVGELGTPVQSVMAVAVMYTLPAAIFYLALQRFIVTGMTAGSVKG